MPLARSPNRTPNQKKEVPNTQLDTGQNGGNGSDTVTGTDQGDDGSQGVTREKVSHQASTGGGVGNLSFRAIGPKAENFVIDVGKIADLILSMKEFLTPNTKNEVRRGTEMVSLAVDKLMRELKEVTIIDHEEFKKLSLDKKLKSSPHIKEEEKLEKIEKAKVEFYKGPLMNQNEVLDVLEKKWPEEAFKIPKISGVDSNWVGGNSAIFLSKEGGKNLSLIKILKSKFPEVEEVTQEGVLKDNPQILEQVTRIRGSNQKVSLCYLTTGEGVKECLGNLCKFRDELEKETIGENSRKVHIVTAETGCIQNMHKAAEFVFSKSGYEVAIVVPSNKMSKNRPKPQQNKAPAGGLIKINSSGMSYADMTKTLKEKVNLEEIGVEVRNIKKGKKDELVITTKNKEGGEKLKEEIIKKVGGSVPEMRVESSGSRIPVLITQIEGTVEVEEVISKILEMLVGEVQLVESKNLEVKLTQNRNGTKMAEVWLERSKAEKVILVGKIKLGWTVCQIKPKVKVVRCYACLKLGHSVFECRSGKKGALTRACFKCTETGHVVSDCKNIAKCNLCNTSGHRADSADCPIFRNYIRKRST